MDQPFADIGSLGYEGQFRPDEIRMCDSGTAWPCQERRFRDGAKIWGTEGSGLQGHPSHEGMMDKG
jgi:hypothetical protein